MTTFSKPATPPELLNFLKSLDIYYRLYEHPAVFTVAESEKIEHDMPGVHCRNLFLRDKKGNFFLVVAANETQIDLKKLPDIIQSGRLSFGRSDQLQELLGMQPGSVCPFAVVNDNDRKVKIILDADMMQGEVVNYHPLVNTMTIGIAPADLLRFFAALECQPEIARL